MKNKQLYKVAESYGVSMVPTISPGDKVHYARVTYQELKPGDIIIFMMNGRHIAHRILKKRGSTIVAKGDNELFADPVIPNHAVLGKVVGVVHANKMYDHTCLFARLYNYYCLAYSYGIYLGYKFIVVAYPKLFRGRKFLLFFMQKQKNE